MKEEARKLLKKAARSIDVAVRLLRDGEEDFAVGRAYYAMFYTAEALLGERDLRFSKHSGVHAAYGQYFAKTGLLDPKYHRWLLAAFDNRIIGDYGVDGWLPAEDVAETIEHAREFLQVATRHLEKPIP
jgi:uncharacterized protein (UPF0332 family)